ncbi:unnamed protein product [Heterobilharzia americana]|nr:unnamed protein product [Heterobilharzia americana]
MSQISIRVQTYLVLGVMIACFSILYPKIFHPMLMHILGLTKSNDKEGHGNFEHFGPNVCFDIYSSETLSGKERWHYVNRFTRVCHRYNFIFVIYTLKDIFIETSKKFR